MAIVSFDTWGVSGNLTEDGSRNYTVEYKAVSDSRDDDPVKVLSYTTVPQYATPYSFGTSVDVDARLVSLDCDYWNREATSKIFRVTANYTTKPGRQPNIGNPELWLPRLYGSFISEVVPLVSDINGDKIEGPLGDTFRDQNKTVGRRTLTIEVTRRTFTAAGVATPVLNSSLFFGRPAKTWKLDNITWNQLFFGTTPYYEIRYEFLFDATGWTYKPKIEGPQYLDAGVRYRVSTDDGFAFADGWAKLDDSGELLDFSTPARHAGDGVTTIAAFDIFESIDFGPTLQIPTSF